MTEKEIREIVSGVLERLNAAEAPKNEIPLEVSARHVHLTKSAVETLFGQGALLSVVRELSQPGQFLSDRRVKLVTPKGAIENVAVLGPERGEVQAELSVTDCRVLGLNAPVRLSGDLRGGADAYIIGERGMLDAKGSVIVAKAHIHLRPGDAGEHGVTDGQSVRVRVESVRPLTFEDVTVRVSEEFMPAMHIDFDEANACCADGVSIARIEKIDGGTKV
ncbi:MAG: phosphate propanoyltransferase [Oscillospiraceae bacterium]|nr:phosphate propanoyltransferase [Oscillospiraceae bacterium]